MWSLPHLKSGAVIISTYRPGNRGPERLQKWSWISQSVGGRPKPRLVDPKALPLISPIDFRHLNQEERAPGDQPNTRVSAPPRPTSQWMWCLTSADLPVSAHKFPLHRPPPPHVLASLHGHIAICSTPPLLCSSERRGDSLKRHQMLGRLTNRAASPERPGRGQKQVQRLCECMTVTIWQAAPHP